MAQVVSKGDESKLWRRITCRNCSAVFEFEEKDVWIHEWHGTHFPHKTLYVSCSDCGGENPVAENMPQDVWARLRESAPVLKED